jgi:transcriptional regulator with XRE-family HTH domain
MPRRAVRVDEDFGDRLREAMMRRRIRPGQLAVALEVRPQTVSRWRRGECPDDLRLPEIATYLRVALEWLKTGKGTFEPSVQGQGVPRASGPGRRREDIELRAAGMRKDAARLDVLLRLIQAYRDAGRPASPEILAEWLEIAAANHHDESEPGDGPTPPAAAPGGPGPPAPSRPSGPGSGPARP